MHYVTAARHEGGWKLKIQFEDGQVRVVDLSRYLDGPVFEPLKDPSYFKLFAVNHDIDTVVWPNGADFSPDFLYEIGESVSDPLHSIERAKRLADLGGTEKKLRPIARRNT
jgi:hypothetical protein